MRGAFERARGLTCIAAAALIGAGPVLAQETKTPRAILERAAFAEEHDRDFDKAAKLYEEAAAAAMSSRDDDTVAAARQGKARVLARAGKTRAAGTETQPGDSRSIENRIYLLVKTLCTATEPGQRDDAKRQLALFGKDAVPILEEALQARRIDSFEARELIKRGLLAPGIAESGFQGDTERAVWALASLNVPEADQALERGLGSADPFVRDAVVRSLSFQRHRPLLERAATDPVDRVRTSAYATLASSSDPSLEPFMERGARAGIAGTQWLARYSPKTLAALAFDVTLAPVARRQAIRSLKDVSGTIDPEWPINLVQAAETSNDKQLTGSALSTLTSLRSRSGPALFDDSLRGRIEAKAVELVGDPDVYTLELLDCLAQFGGAKAVTVLLGQHADKFVGSNAADAGNFLWLVGDRLVPTDFAALADLLDRDVNIRVNNSFTPLASQIMELLSKLAQRGVPASYIMKALDKVKSGSRDTYMRTVVLRGKADKLLLPAYVEVFRTEVAKAGRNITPDSSNLSRAASLIGEVGGASEIPVLLEGLREFGKSWNNTLLPNIGRVAKADPPKATDVFVAWVLQASRSDPTGDRTAVLDVFGVLEPDHALQAFRRLWNEEVPETIRQDILARLVTRIPGPAATKEVFAHLADLSPWGRAQAIERFATELYEPALEQIGAALRDSSEDVRKAARDALKRFKEQREALEEYKAWTSGDKEAKAAIDDLLGLLKSPKREVVLGAVRSLAALKAKVALPTLVKLLETEDAELRAAVNEAIAKIGG